ncbi:hypothetical protein C8Q70DRAFT_83921 [Cubamyces menziesii]|nr:hypothetical protein C8Q70DRAFT_83921 [Cubamyces menziesii]
MEQANSPRYLSWTSVSEGARECATLLVSSTVAVHRDARDAGCTRAMQIVRARCDDWYPRVQWKMGPSGWKKHEWLHRPAERTGREERSWGGEDVLSHGIMDWVCIGHSDCVSSRFTVVRYQAAENLSSVEARSLVVDRCPRTFPEDVPLVVSGTDTRPASPPLLRCFPKSQSTAHERYTGTPGRVSCHAGCNYSLVRWPAASRSGCPLKNGALYSTILNTCGPSQGRVGLQAGSLRLLFAMSTH